MQGGHAGLSRVGTDSSRSVWSGEDVVDAIFGDAETERILA